MKKILEIFLSLLVLVSFFAAWAGLLSAKLLTSEAGASIYVVASIVFLISITAATAYVKLFDEKSKPLEAGDVVRLKSGGPRMIVRHPEAHCMGCYCEWFDSRQPQAKYFLSQTLKRA